jgi:hypothetical protein
MWYFSIRFGTVLTMWYFSISFWNCSDNVVFFVFYFNTILCFHFICTGESNVMDVKLVMEWFR